jgi:hypothetical protein
MRAAPGGELPELTGRVPLGEPAALGVPRFGGAPEICAAVGTPGAAAAVAAFLTGQRRESTVLAEDPQEEATWRSDWW